MQGGIAMSLEAFTWPISAGGAVLVLYSLTLYPKIIKSVGALSFARFGLVLAIPGALLLPTASLFSPYLLEQVKSHSVLLPLLHCPTNHVGLAS